MHEPRPLSESRVQTWRDIQGVFADIDDTLTTGGRVTAGVFQVMERLRKAGLLVIPITGRPAGWCDLIARQWPVDAVVGENGAFYFRYDESNRTMQRVYTDDVQTREENKIKLNAICDEILESIPGCAVSADQAFRTNDLAIDFCEDVEPLSEDAVRKIVGIFTRHGATAKVSSIHVNGWFGDYDKLTMTKRLMHEQFGIDLGSSEAGYTFAGDSPNDAPMFGFFSNAVGVANLKPFLKQCEDAPAWMTQAEGGAGFFELAEHILALR